MSKNGFLWVILVFVLAGCSAVFQGNNQQTELDLALTKEKMITGTLATMSPTAIKPVSTPTMSTIVETDLLTIAVRNGTGSDIYGLVVSCPDKIPCVRTTAKLFNTDWRVLDLSWSKDGKSLAFWGLKDGISDIWVAKDNGKLLTNITNSQDDDESSPDWSPDGKQVTYVTVYKLEDSKIFSWSVDDSKITRIIPNVFEPYQFAWSQRGFAAYRSIVSNQDGRYQVRILDQEGSLYWEIPLDETKENFEVLEFAFSPDGEQLAYIGSWDSRSRIYIANLSDKTVTEIPSEDKTCYEFSPSWSLDGKWIAFRSNCLSDDKRTYSVRLLNLASNQKFNLDTGIVGSISSVAWRPSDK